MIRRNAVVQRFLDICDHAVYPPRFLKPGDTVRIAVTGLGTLSHSFT